MGKGKFSPFSREQLMPKEERLEVASKNGRLRIGIPNEKHLQERRLCLTPDAVQVLVANGHQVLIESKAGESAHYTDNQYSEAGAQISYDRKEVFAQPIVLKVEPPDEEELSWLKPNSYLLSAVQPNIQNKEYFEQLAHKRITAIGYEYIEDDHGHLPVVRLISEIAGTGAVLIAAELLSTPQGGNGILLGGIAGVRPADVVIVGGGTVGEFAAKAALGLGATVRIFDNSISRLRRLQNDVNQRVSTNTLDPKELQKALMRCDVAIGAIRGKDRTPTVVTEDMVSNMKDGSIVIDVAIDNGGCFETSEVTTHDKPVVSKHGVLHYGVTNITSRYARTSSKALSNFFLPYLLQVADSGGFESVVNQDRGLRKGIYMFQGKHTNLQLCKRFNLPYFDINFLIL